MKDEEGDLLADNRWTNYCSQRVNDVEHREIPTTESLVYA
jgi:hypothetical protein